MAVTTSSSWGASGRGPLLIWVGCRTSLRGCLLRAGGLPTRPAAFWDAKIAGERETEEDMEINREGRPAPVTGAGVEGGGGESLARLAFLRGAEPAALATATPFVHWLAAGPGELVLDFGDASNDVFL